MDQLHEDVNRIRSKPQTTNVEGKKNDEVENIARQCWIVFLKRNYSFFINVFFGQFKSVVECPKCGNNSMTFDPFQLVTLVTPDQSKVNYQVYFIPQNNSKKNIRVDLKVKSIHKFNDFKVSQIKELVCAELKVDPSSCVMTNLDFKGYTKIFLDQMKMSSIVEPRSSYSNPNILVYQFSE